MFFPLCKLLFRWAIEKGKQGYTLYALGDTPKHTPPPLPSSVPLPYSLFCFFTARQQRLEICSLYTECLFVFFITLVYNFLFVQNTLFWFQHFSAIVAIVTLCRSVFLHTGHDKPVSRLATPGSFYFLRYHLTGVF